MIPFTPVFIVVSTTSHVYIEQHIPVTVVPYNATTSTVTIPDVPFYSQFKDITSSSWQKVGCGVTSLAMVIEYYKPETVSVNTLLNQGITLGAYQQKNGWSHQGLISLSKKYGLDGNSHDVSKLSRKAALSQFKGYLDDGPVIVSIHYKFDPKSTVPHLVVINGIKDGIVYYNDPAAKVGEKTITEDKFLNGWKRKFIVVRPAWQISLT